MLILSCLLHIIAIDNLLSLLPEEVIVVVLCQAKVGVVAMILMDMEMILGILHLILVHILSLAVMAAM